MQVSRSLADFMESLDAGPRGAADAQAKVAECARTGASVLDLQQMELTDADLATILPSLGALSGHVTELNLFLNELTMLPAGLGALGGLRVLRAGANPLGAVAGGLLPALGALEEVDVGFSETLAALPDEWGGLRALRVLHAGNGRLQALPPSLFECAALEELHVPGNALTELGAGVGRLKRLRVLNVGRNQIKALPDAIAECAALRKLYIYENSLARLPTGLDAIASLEELNFAFNPALPPLPRAVRAKACARATAAFLAGAR